MKKKQNGKKFMTKLVIIAALAIAIGTTTLSYALIDETNSVHIKASEIEDATLIIGTHLIYIGSMNDQIYEAAMKSAEESNQYNRYYKSEIAGGTWYDITEAGTLADITTDGIVVEDKVIESLFMTHHTKSDGITYDLTNKSTVGVFEINDPYDLSEMDELEPIKLQYDVLVQTEEPSETMERDILYIKEIYTFDRRTEKTNEIDAQLKALQAYYDILVRDGAEEAMSDMVMSVMEKLDAARRAEVLGPLNDDQLQKMSQVIAREFTYLKGEITGTYTIAEHRKKKAEEAAKEKKTDVVKETNEEVNTIREKLSELEKEIRTKAQQEYDKVINEYQNNGANIVERTGDGSVSDNENTDGIPENVIAEAQAAYDEVINNYKKEERESLEKQIEDLTSNMDKKADKEAKEAMEEALNAKRDVVEDYVLNSDLLTAVGESMTNVQESYMKYNSKMLTEGAGILGKAEYRFSMELIQNARGGNYSGCDDAVNKLIYLQRINNSVIRQEAEERIFITEELLEEAKKEYSTSLGSGVGEAYRTLTSTAAAATRKNVLNTQLAETETVRNELQFIMQAYIDRMAPEKAMDYLKRCLDNIGDYRDVVKSDAFATYANTSVDSYQEWLTQTMKKLQDLAGGSALDDLRVQKDELQTEMMAALDKNRLDQAKKIETQIEAVDKEIKETEDYLNSVLESEYASESDKALAAAQLGDGNTLAALQDMRDYVVEDIKNGNLDGVGNALEGMEAMASTQPNGVMEALKDIYGELSNQELMNGSSSQLDDLLHQVEELAMNQIGNVSKELTEDTLAALIETFVNENMGTGSLDTSSSGELVSGDGNAAEGTAAEGTATESSDTSSDSLSEKSSKLNEVMESLNEEQMSTTLAGLSMYAERTNAKNINDTLKVYGKNAFMDGNSFVYEQLEHELSEFIPTDKLARVIGYRYIFNDSQKSVTLQRGSQYYQFEAFSSTVKKGTDSVEMAKAAGFKGVIYIPREIAKEYFALTAAKLYNTPYGVILTQEMNELALEFFDNLLEAGEAY